MEGIEQYFQMIWGSIGQGVGPYLATTFMVVVLMPFVLDILMSMVGIKSHLGEKAMHFWGHWFIAWPVKTAWHAVAWVFKSVFGAIFKKKKAQKAGKTTIHNHYYGSPPYRPGPPPGPTP